MECVDLHLGWLLVELDAAQCLLVVGLDRAVLELREIADMLTLLLHEGHALLILEHLMLLVLELRVLHLLLLRHWV